MDGPFQILVVATMLTFTKANSRMLKSSCILIRDTYYEKELLNNNVYLPYQLSIDYSINTLFFTYTGKSTTSEDLLSLSYKVAFLDLETKYLGHVNDVNGGFATAVDNINGSVYIGGANGIYLLSKEWVTARNLDVIDLNIFQMFYRDGLYFTIFPEEEVFLYQDKKVWEIPEFYVKDKVKMFAVKKDGVFVFSNSSGLYSYNETTRAVLKCGNYTVTGFTSDASNNLYFSTLNSIYYFGDSIEELANLGDLFGLAIAKNGDFIYALKDSIYRLKPNKDKCG
ncbi:unnamed protein product [Arctia plantaginis]|uniref:Ommochrome-binding protein-like n=1 Tax=Arctia plantaginis TaxID=874455 RepID=A0A8S0ZR43_ARCPL|nr:unnamed protein product [Arctia plantaginis]